VVIRGKNEIVGLGNVVVIFGIVSKIVQGWHMKNDAKSIVPDSHTKIYAKISIYQFLKINCYWNFLSHKCTTLEFVIIYMCKFLCLGLMMCSCNFNVIYDHQQWWVDCNIFILIWIQNYFINLLQIQIF